MKIRNDSPLGDLDVPLLRRVVERGEVVDVSDEHAAILLAQEIWSPADDDARRIQAELDEPAGEETGEVTGDDVAV